MWWSFLRSWWQTFKAVAPRARVEILSGANRMTAPAVAPAPAVALPEPMNSADLGLGGVVATAPPAVKPSKKRRPLTAADTAAMRALKKKWERERMKHDKWVEPQGPQPVHVERGPRVEEEEEPDSVPIPAIDGQLVPDQIIVDEHHEGGLVLYEASEFWGEFNFRDSILDDLPMYFTYLSRMRKNDPDAYGLYRHVGAVIVPYCTTGACWKRVEGKPYRLDPKEVEGWDLTLTPYFREVRPAFGCVAFGTNPLIEDIELHEVRELHDKKRTKERSLWIPKFMYYNKFSKPRAQWQPVTADGDFYEMTVWWDKPQDEDLGMKHGIPQCFGIWISRDGNRMRVLKEVGPTMVGPGMTREWKDWRIPHEFETWAKGRGVNPQKYLLHIFVGAVKDCEYIDYGMIRVNVHKGPLTAVFCVAPSRTAYFFRDRDITLTVNGHRKRVLHSVAPHKRKDGTIISLHFRGEREFDWAGYHVQLTVPGKHHPMLSSFTAGSEPLVKGRRRKDDMDGEQLGQMFAQTIKGK